MNFDFQMTETLATDILVYVVVGVRHPNYCPSTSVPEPVPVRVPVPVPVLLQLR